MVTDINKSSRKRREPLENMRESDLFDEDALGPRVTYTLVYAYGHSKGGVPNSSVEPVHACELTTDGYHNNQIRWYSSGETLCHMRPESQHGYLIAVKAFSGTERVSCQSCKLTLAAIRRAKLDELAKRRKQQERKSAISIDAEDDDADLETA